MRPCPVELGLLFSSRFRLRARKHTAPPRGGAVTGNRPWDAEPAQGIILLAKNDRLSFCYVK